MDKWYYDSILTAFFMSRNFDISLFIVCAVLLVFGVIYFIDGIKKYGYWRHEKNEGCG